MKLSASRTALSGLALTVAATALGQPLLAPAASAATDAPATSAARAGTGWLATQLTNGVIHNDTYDFDDLGMTMDIGLSMDEVGGDQAMVRQIRSSLSSRVEEYVTGGQYGDPSFRLAGEREPTAALADRPRRELQQRQDTGVVRCLDVVRVQGVPEHQLAAEHAARPLGGNQLGVPAHRLRALGPHRQDIPLHVQIQ